MLGSSPTLPSDKGIIMSEQLRPFPPPPDPKPDPEGLGDDIACEKCGKVALDTGLECSECGHDNYPAIYGKPFPAV